MNSSSIPRFFQIIFTTVAIYSNCNAEMPNSSNPEVMQSITQENIPILGNAPSLNCSNLYNPKMQLPFQDNPFNHQMPSHVTSQQAVILEEEKLYSQDTASTEPQVCRIIETQN
jgi:hypothetical protein